MLCLIDGKYGGGVFNDALWGLTQHALIGASVKRKREFLDAGAGAMFNRFKV